jgi:hypothetical protein
LHAQTQINEFAVHRNAARLGLPVVRLPCGIKYNNAPTTQADGSMRAEVAQFMFGEDKTGYIAVGNEKEGLCRFVDV